MVPRHSAMFLRLLASCWLFVTIDSNPGIKVLISESGLKYAARQVAEVLSKEILKIHLSDIKGSVPFSLGRLNYTLSDIEINGYTRPDVDLLINPLGSVTLTFGEASVAATANVLCKKADGALKFRHSTSVILSVYGVSVFVHADVALDDRGMPTVEATTCSSSMGAIMASFQGDVNSLYTPIARSRKFRRKLHASLGGAMCVLVTKWINSNGVMSTFKRQESIRQSVTLDLGMVSDFVFGPDYIESHHGGRFVGDTSDDEAPNMFLVPERMLTFGISEATLNSAARVLHNNGLLTAVINESEFQELIPKLKNSRHSSSELLMIVSTSSAPLFSVGSKGVFVRLEVHGRLVENGDSDKNDSLASVKLQIVAQLRPHLSYHNLTASMATFMPTVKDASPDSDSDFLRDFVARLSDETRRLGNAVMNVGLPLPRLAGTLYINDHHVPYNRYLSVTCDVIYVPRGEIGDEERE